MYAGVGSIELVRVSDNVIASKFVLLDSLAAGVPANVMFMP